MKFKQVDQLTMFAYTTMYYTFEKIRVVKLETKIPY